MPGHELGSSRHHTLAAIRNLHTNFLLPSLTLVNNMR